MDVIMVSVVSQVFMITVLIFIGFYALIITLLFRAVRDDKKLAEKRAEEALSQLQKESDHFRVVDRCVITLLGELYEKKELLACEGIGNNSRANELCRRGAHLVGLERAKEELECLKKHTYLTQQTTQKE